MWPDILLIVIFIIVNGFFAGAEIAVVTSRRSHIRHLMEEGNKSAEILHKFKDDPERFLATTQIGVTLAGVIAAAIGGATAVKMIKPLLMDVPVKAISASSEAIALGLVTILITFFLLVFGELIPKSIALSNPERMGLRTAPFIEMFSKIAIVFVKILTFSTNMLLKPFGRKSYAGRAYVSEDEVRMLIREGREQGVFEPAEQALIHSVFEFTDMSAKEVMVPSTRMVTISINTPVEEIKGILAEEQFSRYPVRGKDINDIRGILYVKDFLNAFAAGAVDIRKLIKPPFFIPETMKISFLLREMQRKRIHMALVIDEYGGVSGLVTMEDLLEEIVGEIRDEYDTESPVIKIDDRTFLIDAAISIRDLKEDHDIEVPESTEYETLSGFLLITLQKIPKVGDTVEIEGKRITISEMVAQRIAKVKLEKIPEAVSES
jgi:putative hemolysin